MKVQQISFGVSSLVFANLQKRASPLNIRPTEYARRLFEAAYTTRVALERGEQTDDAKLENQVRQVFLLADCEPEYIAEALGLAQPRVEKILEGWRHVAKELVEPTAPALEATLKVITPPPAPTSVQPAAYRTDLYSPSEIKMIRVLWHEGKTTRQIALAVGRPLQGLKHWLKTHRDLCPSRKGG